MLKLSRENKMVAKVVAVRIILPVAIVAAVVVIVNKLDKDTPTED